MAVEKDGICFVVSAYLYIRSIQYLRGKTTQVSMNKSNECKIHVLNLFTCGCYIPEFSCSHGLCGPLPGRGECQWDLPSPAWPLRQPDQVQGPLWHGHQGGAAGLSFRWYRNNPVQTICGLFFLNLRHLRVVRYRVNNLGLPQNQNHLSRDFQFVKKIITLTILIFDRDVITEARISSGVGKVTQKDLVTLSTTSG